MNSNYHLKNRSVEARHHDGTDKSATDIVAWILANKGEAYPILKGEAPLEGYLTEAYVVVKGLDGKMSGVLRQNFWIVLLEPGNFMVCYPDIFKRIFKPLKGKTDEVVSTTA